MQIKNANYLETKSYHPLILTSTVQIDNVNNIISRVMNIRSGVVACGHIVCIVVCIL